MKAFIFDLDGTILDSTGIWLQIDVDFLKRRKIKMPDDYPLAVSIMPPREAALYTIKRFSLDESVESLCGEWLNMASDAYRNIKAKPFAVDYLKRVKTLKIPVVIASASSVSLINTALSNLGIQDLFDVIVTSDDVKSNKNSPDIFLLAAQKLKTDPKDCVVFEDSLQAIMSAKSTGMKVYAILDDRAVSDWEEIKTVSDGYFIDFEQVPFP